LPEVKRSRTFSATYRFGNLPGLDLFFVVIVFIVVIVVVVIVDVVILVVDVVIRILKVLNRYRGDTKTVSVHKHADWSYDVAGSVPGGVGLAFSRAGGGYVVQKCRPHFGHTQN